MDLVKIKTTYVRPRHYRPRSSGSTLSNYPYYRHSYASELKKHIDSTLLFPDGSINILAELEFPLKPDAHGPQRRTLRQRITQSWCYLVEHLDNPATRIYRLIRDWTIVSVERSCVAIRWKEIVKQRNEVFMEQLRARQVATNMPDKPEKKWKIELEEFLLTAEEGTTIIKNGLQLYEADVDYITTVIAGIPHAHVLKLTYTGFIIAYSSALEGALS